MKTRYRKIILSLALMLAFVFAAGCQQQSAAPAADAAPAAIEVGDDGMVRMGDFPSKNIEVVTHSGVGGGGDLIGRAMIAAGQKYVPETMVVVNKQGAASNNMAAYLADGKTDGHTINVATPTNLLWYLQGQNDMDIHEYLIPIARMQVEPQCVIVNVDSPFQTFEEFSEAYGNGEVKIGSDPIGGSGWIFTAALSKQLGVEISYVPYADGAEANTALLGGNVDAAYTQFIEAVPLAEGGMVRILAVAEDERIGGEFADIPTMKEAGFDYVFPQWRGFFARAGTPDAQIQYWAEALKKAHDDESFQTWLSDNSSLPGYMGPEEFRAFIIEQEEFVVQMLKENAPEMLREGY